MNDPILIIDSFSGAYEFLSNFYVSPIIVNGLEYRTVEHAFQAAKALNDLDIEWIRSAPTQKKEKRASL